MVKGGKYSEGEWKKGEREKRPLDRSCYAKEEVASHTQNLVVSEQQELPNDNEEEVNQRVVSQLKIGKEAILTADNQEAEIISSYFGSIVRSPKFDNALDG
ncbi:hypothetical protein ACET3Z_013615 [Daucus carota]